MVVQVAQCNIRSLNTSSKQIEDLCKLKQISILSLTEIWHPEVSSLKFLHKWNWNVSVRVNKEGGGAATIINPLLKTHPRKDLNNPGLEAAWCEIFVENRKILVCSVYIPPGEASNMDLLINIMESVSSNNENILIMGDLNAKHPMWYNNDTNTLGDKLSSYLTGSEYNIANNQMYTYKSSIIDLTLVKGCKNLLSSWSAYPDIFVNTDHTVIMFNLSLKVKRINKPKWNTKRADWEVWKERSKVSHQTTLNKIKESEFPNIDDDYKEVRESILELGRDCIGKTLGKSNSKPWWNNDIGQKYKDYKKAQKNMSKRCDQEKVKKYKDAMNEFLVSYHESKQKYLEESIKELDGDDKNMWKVVKRFNNMPNDYSIQPLMNSDGKILYTDEEIAGEFNKQYGKSQFTVEPERFQEIRNQAGDILRRCDLEGDNDVINKEIITNEIKKAYMVMREDTGYNPIEDIDSKMLKNSDEAIYDLLHYMYNTWLSQGDIPAETKVDYKKLHQKPNKESYNKWESYRPISLESLISKCFLRIIRERVDWRIEVNNRLSVTQEAYRKDRSGNDIKLRLVQSIQEAWNKDETVVLAVIDYDSFFENIWRDLLLVKLHELGVRGKVLKVLYNYLKGRKYCFEVNELVSELKDSNMGVPQGGIPSTTMANAYTYDSDTTPYNIHAEFSDDNIKLETHRDEATAIKNLQERLDQFSLWCKKNNIILSPWKCKIMIFRPKNSPRPFNMPKIVIDGQIIEVVEQKRILGTVIDCNLDFEAHFQSIEKACFSAFNTIKHLYAGKTKPSIETGVISYRTLVRQVMDYSILAITNINQQQLQKMQSIQHKCLRLVTQSLSSSS